MPDLLKERFEQNPEGIDYSPLIGHRGRFERKLKARNQFFGWRLFRSNYFWYSSAAAILVLLIGIVTSQIKIEQQQIKAYDLADVSESLSQQAKNYQVAIDTKLKEIDTTNPEIKQNLKKLEHLENEYIRLRKALTQNFGNQKVIMVMIQNYKNRLMILENMLIQIEIIDSTKDKSNIRTHA